ncbi:hypothetical protein AMTRI_Chr09g17750 [Amborella trichopoda]|uniref:Uncharacterized protein n=1 Tax=Amborella trichopoda TaxID=13333 RepID=W1PE86_AMBTC|nr:GDSL esterase/lipase At5g41890 [Amborella trichopoda]ERN08242.1 hypothetical protein AMTR_s00018p00237660 [Amborella trichopoda]|eukprot:XP_006846567.1 GDSL esterase/lipase At5g41890 [Amborella trichopoda]
MAALSASFLFYFVSLILAPAVQAKTLAATLKPMLYAFPSYLPFIFGDSLVDAGNNDYILTLSKADSPPYGIDFTAFSGQPTGRFTNGKTISDIVGESLGAKTYAAPYLAPTTHGSVILGGVNYASGASGILNETGSIFIGRVPLAKQVDYFEETREELVKMVGEKRTREILKEAIISVAAGANDILNYLQPPLPIIGKKKVTASELQDAMVSNLTLQLKRLHTFGARKFVVVDVGPLGCIPLIRALNLVANGGCSSDANKAVVGYNKKLYQMLQKLNIELGPQAIFVYANSYDIVMDIVQNRSKYGFEDGNNPCCGAIPPFICIVRKDTRNNSSMFCDDRSKFVFWDVFHPTEAANNIIANKLLDGDKTSAFPFNIRQLHKYKA